MPIEIKKDLSQDENSDIECLAYFFLDFENEANVRVSSPTKAWINSNGRITLVAIANEQIILQVQSNEKILHFDAMNDLSFFFSYKDTIVKYSIDESRKNKFRTMVDVNVRPVKRTKRTLIGDDIDGEICWTLNVFATIQNVEFYVCLTKIVFWKSSQNANFHKAL